MLERNSPQILLQQDCNRSSTDIVALKKWTRSLCDEQPETKLSYKMLFVTSTSKTRQILMGTETDRNPRTNRTKRPKSRSTQKTKSNTNSSKHFGDMAVTEPNVLEKPATQARVHNRPYQVILKKEAPIVLLPLTLAAPRASGEPLTLCCNHLRICKQLLWTLCLQEASLQQNEALAVQRHVAKLGYIAYYTPGSTSTNRWGQTVAEGGVLSIIHCNIHSTFITEHGHDDFQHQFIQAGQWTIINSYSPPREGCGTKALEVWHEVMMQTVGNHQARPWISAGDTNMNTKNSPLTHTASIHNGEAAPGSTEDTSRWNSQTYIDHIITNQPHNTSNVSTLPWRISDHKCKTCNIAARWQQETHRRVLKTSGHWTAPPHLQTSDWTDALRQAWLGLSIPITTTVGFNRRHRCQSGMEHVSTTSDKNAPQSYNHCHAAQ